MDSLIEELQKTYLEKQAAIRAASSSSRRSSSKGNDEPLVRRTRLLHLHGPARARAWD
jgi:hypothetical protein